MFRQEKLNKLFVQQLNQLIKTEIQLEKNVLLTISRARVAANLSSATVFVSCLPFDQSQETIKLLLKNKNKLALNLEQKLKLKRVPQLIFKLDQSLEEGEKIEEIINHI